MRAWNLNVVRFCVPMTARDGHAYCALLRGILAGISITAGHDCLFEQSYPVLFNATMSRVAAAAGVRWVLGVAATATAAFNPFRTGKHVRHEFQVVCS